VIIIIIKTQEPKTGEEKRALREEVSNASQGGRLFEVSGSLIILRTEAEELEDDDEELEDFVDLSLAI
jgi:hypothetical protein